MPGTPRSLLILGGTREAAELAERLSAHDKIRIVTSLAGRTRDPELPASETRIGGFGGPDGLAAYLRDEGFDLIVDATHPFAETISANAAAAAELADVPLLRLQRPAWNPETGDDWQSVASLDEACRAIPQSARVFLALGRQYIDAFAEREDVFFVVRMVDLPQTPLPFASFELVIGKPLDSPDREAALLRFHAITRIVCRNSGGDGSYAKIVAARDLSIPVIMIERPAITADRSFSTVNDLLAAIT
ncbi:cobalt-precorrin-6A reductase [Hoeflea sp. TYP-13]|uniref:cobalt-precorrin-6A reductase n=1 Tax=Hoeflea sp. TYP-13 TaxID=3230023 RepID=UPI0034C66043